MVLVVIQMEGRYLSKVKVWSGGTLGQKSNFGCYFGASVAGEFTGEISLMITIMILVVCCSFC